MQNVDRHVKVSIVSAVDKLVAGARASADIILMKAKYIGGLVKDCNNFIADALEFMSTVLC